MRTTLLLFAIALAPLLLTACAQQRSSGVPARDDLSGTWTLVSIDGEDPADLVDGDAPMLNVAPTDTPDGDRPVTGFAGVNRFFGDADGDLLDEGGWSIGALGMTRMMGPEPAMRLERRFASALSGPGTVRIEDGRLVIAHEDGSTLIFTR